jgi:hypothetical protein
MGRTQNPFLRISFYCLRVYGEEVCGQVSGVKYIKECCTMTEDMTGWLTAVIVQSLSLSVYNLRHANKTTQDEKIN